MNDDDQLELVEFSDRARRFEPKPVRATASARSQARQWLMKLRASGSTEMSDAIVEALRSVRPEAQRQVVLITDGAIGFETEVIREVSARLPAGSRLHTVGVGSSVNRALTARAARAGRGVEVVIGLGEDPERAVARLLARTSKPVLVELELGGSALREVAPSRLPDLFSGAPVLFGVRLSKEGGKIKVSGKLSSGSRFERELEVPPIAEMTNSAREGAALAALFARERVEDLELELAAGGSVQELDAEIEALGVKFGILTRLTSWVAVDELVSVDPTRPFRSVRQPHAVRYLCARARAPSLCQCRGDGWPAPRSAPHGSMPSRGRRTSSAPPVTSRAASSCLLSVQAVRGEAFRERPRGDGEHDRDDKALGWAHAGGKFLGAG